MEDCVKGLGNVIIYYTYFSPLSVQPVIPLQKGNRWVKHNLPSINLRCLFLIAFLSIFCLEITFTTTCSLIFPGAVSRLTSQLFSGSSSLPFLKMGATFAFFQPSGTSPDDREWLHSNTSQLPQHPQCIPFGPMDLQMSSLLKWSSALFSLAGGSIFFPRFCH